MRIALCVVWVMFHLRGVLSASARKIADIPNPMKDPLACGRPNVAKSAVCDPDHLLKKDSKDEIEGYINAITQAQVAVAVIDKMNLADLGTSDIDIGAEKFARSLHDTWGVGTAENGDGIVVFLSIKDRAVFISTGSGAHKTVNFGATQAIIADMKPSLRKADYGAAVVTCIIELDLYLSGQGSQIRSKYSGRNHVIESDSGMSDTMQLVLTVLMFAGIISCGVYSHRRREAQMRGYERGRAALESLMRDVDNTEANNKFYASSCPICLEEFPQNAVVVNDDGMAVTHMVEPSAPPAPLLDPYNPEDKDSDNEQTESLLPSAPPAATSPTHTHTHTASAGAAGAAGKMQAKALRCGHTFCATCLESLLRTTQGDKCPICRMPVEGDAPRPDNGGGDGPPQPRSFFGNTGNSGTGAGSGSGSGSQQQAPYTYDSSSYDQPSCADSFRTEETTTTTNDYTSHSSSTFSSSSSSTFGGTSSFFARRAPEYRYRINRMRHLYPDVMTIEMMRLMNSSIDRGNLHDFRHQITNRTGEVTRLVADIRAQAAAAARSSGSRGSSGGGFGGGRSSGGGGGRW